MITRIIEDGFVKPLEPLESPGSEKTESGPFRILCLPGIDTTLQYFRVSLTSATTSLRLRESVVICANHPALTDEAIASNTAALSTHFPGQVLLFLRQSRTGWARVTCVDSPPDEVAAAATAAVMALGGWDESSPIVVEVDTHPYDVFLEFRDKQWVARVQPSK